MSKKKHNMKHLFDDIDSKEEIIIRVYQNDKETNAVVTDRCNDRRFLGKAVKSDNDEFDSRTGARLAIARAKKEYLLSEVERFKFMMKQVVNELNSKLEKIEFLDKKYGLNREARNNPSYKGKKASFNISKK